MSQPGLDMERTLARTKRRISEQEELRRWREGLDDALRKQKKGVRRFVRGFAMAVVIVLAVTAGAGAYFWRNIEGLFTRTDLVLDPAGGGALNVLLIGSDSREWVTDPEDARRFGTVGGNRADTIILAQVVPSQKRGILVHFPRDLWVTIPGSPERRSFEAKINSAYGLGPQALVDTVQGLSGLPINHYMEIDLQGFRQMVDAVSGVDICLSQPLYDSKLRFRLPAGHVHLDGDSALSFVRARHASSDGDFGRIRRQQQFLKAVVQKVGSPSILGNPVRVNELARAFAANVTVDQHFQLDDMVRFALSVKRIGPDSLETKSVPGRVGAKGGQSVVLVDDAEARALFDSLRDPLTEPEAAGPVATAIPQEPDPAPPEQAPEPVGPCP